MTLYRFPKIDQEILNTTKQRDILKDREKDINNLNVDVSDIKAYNKNLNTVYSDILYRQNLDKKIAYLKAQSRIPDPNSMPLNQFITGLSVDLCDMYDELLMKNNPSVADINQILDKNYRRLTVLFILLFIFLLTFYILSIKSYLCAEERIT